MSHEDQAIGTAITTYFAMGRRQQRNLMELSQVATCFFAHDGGFTYFFLVLNVNMSSRKAVNTSYKSFYCVWFVKTRLSAHLNFLCGISSNDQITKALKLV